MTHRPPPIVRAAFACLAALAFLAAGLLLLSDRAPGILEDTFGGTARRVSDRIGDRSGVDLQPGETLPDVDVVVHIAIWATVTALIGLALWSWLWLVATAAGVATTSLAVELVQERWSRTREFELEDAVGNLAGVTVGALVAASCYLLWSLVAGAIDRRRSRT